MVTIMKKLLNLKYMTLFAVLALFSACTEEDDYTPAQPSAVEETEYFFNREQATSAVLPLSASEYVVVLERVNNEETVTLNLNVNAVDSVFTVPKTVTFEAGANTAEILIAINDNMAVFEDYAVEISLPEEYINPYKMDNYSVFVLKLKKDDYAPYAKGIYNWGFAPILVKGAELKFEQEILYSEYLDTYRMISPWSTPAATYVAWGCGAEPGENVEFQINEETGEVTLLQEVMTCGLIHPSYGSVYANFVSGNVDEEGNINFEYKWTVSAGSFGSAIDQLQIVEIYE
jgi:hypothetical protein